MNKQKIIILAATVLLLLTGCEDNNQGYRDMPNSVIEPMLKEWVSPDGCIIGCIEMTIAAG